MKSLISIYLTQTANGGWTPRIGDPTFVGWLTVVFYFAVAYLCYRNAKALTIKTGFNSLAVSWWIITSVLLFLGFNKQLDLQSLMTEIGRKIMMHEGWYANRRTIQKQFVIALATGGFAMLFVDAWILRRHLRSLRLVFIGTTILMTFIILRAASFHHVDRFLGFQIAGFRTNWILELGSLALIGLGAFRQTG